jgi:hypothetical protein
MASTAPTTAEPVTPLPTRVAAIGGPAVASRNLPSRQEVEARGNEYTSKKPRRSTMSGSRPKIHMPSTVPVAKTEEFSAPPTFHRHKRLHFVRFVPKWE